MRASVPRSSRRVEETNGLGRAAGAGLLRACSHQSRLAVSRCRNRERAPSVARCSPGAPAAVRQRMARHRDPVADKLHYQAIGTLEEFSPADRIFVSLVKDEVHTWPLVRLRADYRSDLTSNSRNIESMKESNFLPILELTAEFSHLQEQACLILGFKHANSNCSASAVKLYITASFRQ